ncbi:glycosyltransferase [Bathymodiolus azoricus thioautotrophic gill symbiont]|jgi:glycosyltransferase involved in cell wall biosynthesis|uniref:Group 1 glycosyl transferase n=1 Tax=Bathymodiolus azoricus thioautotrophic gill symbiont TaxID=235205 RepID=A0A1H6M535_9GAMM|nr:glycosyltransferase [Bathymodiolus azoricus thioautotrophic gill symbiont]CAC9519906.1 Glycosyltransferase [uncultured Gammaproteobacteria bacterium]CAC9999716.1 Glycosyltransferase [uncultured Gammaproteobacteria bacterium]SEH92557.1 group 1 glycosyl transferase [Bathymodiolus azoricus thioautotrophic gill symbiont]
MYDYVIVTHIPAFYKVNLYNELAKKLNILVIFIALNTSEKRSDDFTTLKNARFEYKVLFDGNFQNRDAFKNISKIKQILKEINYKKLLVSGWDLKEFWYLVFTHSKVRNCLALESTVLESNTKGLKRLVKSIFLNRISTVFASGKLHVELLEKLNYKGNIKITKGVGIINKPDFVYESKIYQKRFLFIGRLSKVKNLEFLINIFNDLKDYKLTIIGTGEDEKYLKSIANKNIVFLGTIENKDIKNEFKENDIFIFPSISEPWGLVVEEALYFGLPVIVSENCGASELIENSMNGYIFKPKDSIGIRDIVLNIDKMKYDVLAFNVKQLSIDNKDKLQVIVYE